MAREFEVDATTFAVDSGITQLSELEDTTREVEATWPGIGSDTTLAVRVEFFLRLEALREPVIAVGGAVGR